MNTIATCFEVKYGMGRHAENVSAAEGAEQLKVRGVVDRDGGGGGGGRQAGGLRG